ncbi:MAG: hypothetical protein P1U36_03485 [Legionellaceae bacterium]|nr:hypothetical protein [Legionellaceae bacterium]
MFKAQIFQNESILYILAQKPCEPLNPNRRTFREGDFLLHIPPECSEKILYKIDSNQFVPKGLLQNKDLIEAAENSVKNGAKHFKRALVNQTGNEHLVLCNTVQRKCALYMAPLERKALINGCRLPSIPEELDDLDELNILGEINCKLPCEDASPLTIAHQHSPVHEKQKEHDDAEIGNAACRV